MRTICKDASNNDRIRKLLILILGVIDDTFLNSYVKECLTDLYATEHDFELIDYMHEALDLYEEDLKNEWLAIKQVIALLNDHDIHSRCDTNNYIKHIRSQKDSNRMPLYSKADLLYLIDVSPAFKK